MFHLIFSRRKNGQDFADVKAEDQPFSRNYEERVPPLFSYVGIVTLLTLVPLRP